MKFRNITEKIKGGWWDLEISDENLVVTDGFEEVILTFKTEDEFRVFLTGLRELAAKLGWSETE